VEGLPLGFGDPADLACGRILNIEKLGGLGSAIGEEIPLRHDSHPAAVLEKIKGADRAICLDVPQPGRIVIGSSQEQSALTYPQFFRGAGKNGRSLRTAFVV